jgi:ABC-type multidrug transport system ATPase subunit
VRGPAAPARISAESVVVRRRGREILRQAYVDAVPGTVTGLVGRTGAGKTTLLRVLVGRLRPDAGQVRWEGTHQRTPDLPRLARRGLAYLPDHPWLSPRLSIEAHLQFASRRSGADWRRAAETVGIQWGARLPDALSTGERRLSELALALALGATALVLDEPYRELDPLHRERLVECLRSLARGGAAVLFADHDVSAVLAGVDRLFGIEDGATRAVPGFRDRPVAEWYASWATARDR